MQDKINIAKDLLDWYHENRRILPFREDPTPYHVWISEIMLQQTQVAAALPYYQRFIQALPEVENLAACGDEALNKLWEGLGYYSRARNLKKAAIMVMQNFGGQLPPDYDSLLSLPGIGPYTAGAIASIAFGLPYVAVDGNVLRVGARLVCNRQDVLLPATKKELTQVVSAWQPQNAPGDFNQALMELGALVCIPGLPRCAQCPLGRHCRAKREGQEGQLPVKAPPKAKKDVDVTLLVLRNGPRVLLQKRPAKGLLAGMWQPLLWEEALGKKQAEERLKALLPKARVLGPLPEAKHVFTHRIWNMRAFLCEAPESATAPEGTVFVSANQLEEGFALPGAFKAYLPAMLA